MFSWRHPGLAGVFESMSSGQRRRHALGIGRTVTFNVIAPLVALQILQSERVPLIVALVCSSLFPAGEVLYTFLRQRHLDVLGVLSFGMLTLGALTALVGGDIRLALIKESAVSCVFGTLCLVSLVRDRPLMFYLAREFFADGEPTLFDAWERRWSIPPFRHALRHVTAVWGIASFLEAGLRVGLVLVIQPAIMAFVSPGLAVVVTLGLIVWSLRYWAAAVPG